MRGKKKRPHILFAATETVKKEGKKKKKSVNLITVQNQNTDLFHLCCICGEKTKLRAHFLNKALQIAL